ncbi:MAG: hypothetical protein CO040_03545, partial [Candidatus Pacebacteria bacterium CG_4_9_14_0_2_um_filter_36_8]
NVRQLITPSEAWDYYGCEDPRVTKIDGKYLIFYTGLSEFPPNADSIKVGLAISTDLRTISAKHLVTPFNAKAMVLFPEKINNQYVAILTVNTDRPPSSVAMIKFDRLEQLWDYDFWFNWYQNLDQHVLPIIRLNTDHIEVGAAPVKTRDGWVLVYSHIQHYYEPNRRIFGIEALLLDSDDPAKIIGRTTEPFLEPELEYEVKGLIPNVVFPSGAMVRGDDLLVFYGAADTVVAMAKLKLDAFLSYLKQSPYFAVPKLTRAKENPILVPLESESWKAQAVFNTAAVLANDKVHLLYRAMSWDNTSVIGHALSDDGFVFEQIDHDPVYIPRIEFEHKTKENCFSGCEDPRITKFEDKYYMFYTAYNGSNPPQVALSSISVEDFEQQKWLWSEPILISDPNTDNKNACLFPKKINDKFVVLHRVMGHEIAIDLLNDLNFKDGTWLEKEGSISPRPGHWDSAKIGIAGPPMETEKGWLLIYHGVSEEDKNYRLGYAVLDLNDPFKVIYRSEYPILEPVEQWEKIGIVNNVVFSCGAVIKDDRLFVYYGGADRVIGVATIEVEKLLAPVK